MSESQNGAMRCTVAGKEAEADFEYVACTMFAACTLRLLDTQNPRGGKCTVCGQAAKIGVKFEHAAFIRHMVKASVLDSFPRQPGTPQSGGRPIRVVEQPLAVVIERNGEVAFQAPMMLMNPQPKVSASGFRLLLELAYDEVLQGPKGPRALSELRLSRGRILTEE